MKIDIEYISTLLDVFLNSETAHINVTTFQKAGIAIESTENSSEFDESFIFHIQIALDNSLISNKELQVGGLKSIGITVGLNGHGMINAVPIRLTQRGHDFATALQNRNVLQKLKTEFKDAPFKVIFDGSQKLIQHYFTKKLDQIIGWEAVRKD